MNGFFTGRDGMPVLALGLQAHNSSTGTAQMDKAVAALREYGGNTIEAPIYWKSIERADGVFDLGIVRDLVELVRREDIYLIPLWFGASKNGHPTYAPDYVKLDPSTYRLARGENGAAVASLSAHCRATLEADKRAFARVMECLRELDGRERRVLAVQVENEIGLASTDRDCGTEAEADYRESVPAELDGVRLEDSGVAGGGQTWRERFGRHAHEAFSAWHHAKYLEEIAAAGKSAFEVPIFANAMIGEQGNEEPGLDYSSGAPVGRVLEIYKRTAPSVDILCPDLYCSSRDEYERACGRYDRRDNPLFVPETHCVGLAAALNCFRAVAGRGAIGFFGFGAESALDPSGELRPEARPVALSMRTLAGIAPLLIKYRGTSRIHTFIQDEFKSEQYLRLPRYHVLAKFTSSETSHSWLGSRINWRSRENAGILEERGRAVLVHADDDTFYAAGIGTQFFIRARPSADEERPFGRLCSRMASQLNFLSIEEGHFRDGLWISDYGRNGDEAYGGVYLHEGETVRVRLNPAGLG